MTKLKTSRIMIPHRVVAFLLVWSILLNIMPYQLAKAENVNLDGIGIYNHMMTDQTDLQTVYHVRFYQTIEKVTPSEEEGQPPVTTYQYQEVGLAEEYPLYDTSGKIVYLDSEGEMILEKNQAVNFIGSSNSAFQKFLINHNITRIVIDVDCQEMRNGEPVKTYEQYASTVGFSGSDAEYDSESTTTGDPADENIPSNREIYKLQYGKEGNGTKIIVRQSEYQLKQFNLTPMVDHDVYVQWRDTGSRPANQSILFDITRDDAPYITGSENTENSLTYGGVYAGTETTAQRTITEIDSNNILYTYSVPEYSPNNKKYHYNATEENPVANYYIEKGENSHFTNYYLKDFSCTVKWEDTALPANFEKQITSEFIRSHFELLDETADGHVYNALKVSAATLAQDGFPAETKQFIEATYDKITENGIAYYVMKVENILYENGKIIIKNLQEITADGTAKTFALKPMTTTSNGKETINQIPVYEVAGKNSSEAESLYTGASADSYLPSAENTGVRSNVVDRAYDGATLSLLLTGKTEFKGPLQWADSAKESARQTAVANGTAGDFILYRYVDTGDNASDSQMISQVGTWKINNETDEQGNPIYIYRDSNNPDDNTNQLIDKYDNTGAAYFYFAKERLSLEEYEIKYIHSGTVPNKIPFNNGADSAVYNGANVFLNGAVVKNSLTGAVGYGIDAEWIAAELQGGTATIDYKLQRFINGAWVDVYSEDKRTNSTTGKTEYYVNGEWTETSPEHEDPETLKITYDGLLTINGFSAELM